MPRNLRQKYREKYFILFFSNQVSYEQQHYDMQQMYAMQYQMPPFPPHMNPYFMGPQGYGMVPQPQLFNSPPVCTFTLLLFIDFPNQFQVYGGPMPLVYPDGSLMIPEGDHSLTTTQSTLPDTEHE